MRYEKPIDGFASVVIPENLEFENTVEVSTKEELLEATAKGNQIVVLTADIDMSNGVLENPLKSDYLNNIVKENTSYKSYKAFKEAYIKACDATINDRRRATENISKLHDDLWKCHNAYDAGMTITLASNTALISYNKSKIKGAFVKIAEVENVIVDGIVFQDAYDPFPHHEVKADGRSDGFNAEYDNLYLRNAKGVFITNCIFEDTIKSEKVKVGENEEEFTNFDGLVDIKGESDGITISECVFRNHNKTILLGSSDKDGEDIERRVTFRKNCFYHCKQRMPLIRNFKVHFFNNYILGGVENTASIEIRFKGAVISEKNAFDSVKKAFIGSPIYSSKDKIIERKKGAELVTYKPFEIPYKYEIEGFGEVFKLAQKGE